MQIDREGGFCLKCDFFDSVRTKIFHGVNIICDTRGLEVIISENGNNFPQITQIFAEKYIKNLCKSA
jgi:hypothetical protein